MSKVKLTLPGLEIPVTGKPVTFKAPCDCSGVECIQINGVDYTVVDAMGNKVTGTGGVWCSGAQISVVLDCENKKAYLQNGNITPALIGAGMVNPNLLHNWYFGNPVNQRGQTEYVGAGYMIDRWQAKGVNSKITLLSDGIQFGKGDTTGYAYFRQFVEGIPEGAALTASVIANGNLHVVSVVPGWVYPTEGASELGIVYIPVENGVQCSLNIKTTTNNLIELYFYFGSALANEVARIKLSAAKLELGSTQTLAHQNASGKWVLNEIPDYNEELLKCCMSKADSSDTYANNKQTPAAINAVSKSGDTMTGNLTIDTGAGSKTQLISYGNRAWLRNFTNASNYQDVKIGADQLIYGGMTDGKDFSYNILHTGNMDSLLSSSRILEYSYTGAGAHGSASTVQITMPKAPKLVVVTGGFEYAVFPGAKMLATGIWVSGSEYMPVLGVGQVVTEGSNDTSVESTPYLTVSLVENGDGTVIMQLYGGSDLSTVDQLNYNGASYRVVAIF